MRELIQESEDRSEARLEHEPDDQQLPPNIELLPSAEPGTDTVSEVDTNLRSALREIFSWRNYFSYSNPLSLFFCQNIYVQDYRSHLYTKI